MNSRNLSVIKQLGEGGFSYVYLVKDRTDGRMYALKKITIQLEEQAINMKAEIDAHGFIDSPYVIKLLDHKIIVNEGKIVEGLLLLPLMKNGTIQDMLQKQKLTFATIVNLGCGICKGLLAFHSAIPSLVFRDLKPANVLINGLGDAVLMDLGSVDSAQLRITSRRQAMNLQDHCANTCTAPFRAPELFDPPSDCLITEATDVWSLGCTLYAMAYGESPFDGSHTAAVSAQLSFPANDSNPSAFQSLIRKALQPIPNARPTVTYILAELQRM